MASAAFAGQWTGWVTDSKCAHMGDFTGPEHVECVKNGQAVVFVNDADKKVFTVTNPDIVRSMIGQKVTINGTLKGDSIEAESIVKARTD